MCSTEYMYTVYLCIITVSFFILQFCDHLLLQKLKFVMNGLVFTSILYVHLSPECRIHMLTNSPILVNVD